MKTIKKQNYCGGDKVIEAVLETNLSLIKVFPTQTSENHLWMINKKAIKLKNKMIITIHIMILIFPFYLQIKAIKNNEKHSNDNKYIQIKSL